MTAEIDRLRQAEAIADAARAQVHRREAARHTGVAWSGMAPDPCPARPAEALARDAAGRLAALQDWRRSCPGRLLAAMTEAERAVERVRACVARGLAASDARCGVALADLQRAASAAQQAMDATASGVLSDAACAMNSASSCPSTALSMSSAS